MDFRYCSKCKDFVKATLFKTNTNATLKSGVCDKHEEVQETEVMRFCRICNDHIPISDFPAGQKRFVCKKHFAIQNSAKCQENRLKIPGKINAERAWNMCYRDSKKFPNINMNLTQQEIIQILLQVDPFFKTRLIILPLNPSIDISKDNVVVLNNIDRKKLMKCVSKGDLRAYSRIVHALVKV